MKSIWKFYAKTLQQWTWTILLLSSAISVSLSIYFSLCFRLGAFDQQNFVLPDGPAMKNIPRIEKLFGNDKNLRVHQQMDLYPALDVIVRHRNQSNMLDKDVLREFHRLDEFIQTFRLENRTYPQLCARFNLACMIDGNYLLSKQFERQVDRLPFVPNGIYIDSSDGANGISSFIFGKHFRVTNVTEEEPDYVDEEEEDEEEEDDEVKTTSAPKMKEIVSFVPLFRLRYALNVSTAEFRRAAVAWERAVLKALNEQFRSDLIEFAASTSTAISDSVSGLAREEGIFVAVLFSIFFVFICLAVSFQGDMHTSVGYLSVFGIFNFILSSGATVGLLTLMRIEIIEPMALLVFVVAVLDCMRSSLVCGVYHRLIEEYLPSSSTSNPAAQNIDIETILYQILRSSFGAILCSTWILTFVYLILSWISPIPCIEILCLTFALYVLVNTCLHGTFFSSLLVLTLKRLESYRHCLTCLPLAEDFYQKIPQARSEKRGKKRFTLGTTSQTFLSAFVCLVSLLALLFSLWTIPSIDTRLFEDRFLPRNASSLRSYMKSQVDDYTIGPVIMFVIPEPLNYQNKSIRKAMSHLLEQCLNESTTNRFNLFWPQLEDLRRLLFGPDPIPMRITPYSENDLIIRSEKNKSRSIITASRFFCQFQSVKGDRDDLRTMSNLYTFANQSGLTGIFPYSLVFTHYEALGQFRVDIAILILVLVLFTFVFSWIYSRSLVDALIISVHFLLLHASTLACLYIFHDLTINFANSLWFYLIPVIYLDAYLHRSSPKTISKWIYNRVLFALILSLLIFTLLPIESYLYHIIHQSLLYQSVITLILLNVSLPSWMKLVKRSKTEKLPNLVYEPTSST